jgi:hypothetical protein
MTPDLALAQRHVELLTGSADTVCCFRLLPVLPGKRSNLRGIITELWPQIVTAQDEDKQNVFIVVNGGGHDGDAINHLRAGFIDCDGTAEPPTTFHIEPDFLIHRDATHWHAYWLLDIQKTNAPWEAAGQWEDAQRRLAAHYDTDKGVHDLPRIMRLAGSLHLKDPTHPYLVRIEPRRAGAPRSGPELMAGIPLLPEPPPHTAPSPASGEPVSIDIVRDMLDCVSPDRHREESRPDVGWRDLVVAVMSAPGPEHAELRKLAHDWVGRNAITTSGSTAEIDHVIDTMPPVRKSKGDQVSFGTLVKLARAGGYTGPISIAEQKRREVWAVALASDAQRFAGMRAAP